MKNIRYSGTEVEQVIDNFSSLFIDYQHREQWEEVSPRGNDMATIQDCGLYINILTDAFNREQRYIKWQQMKADARQRLYEKLFIATHAQLKLDSGMRNIRCAWQPKQRERGKKFLETLKKGPILACLTEWDTVRRHGAFPARMWDLWQSDKFGYRDEWQAYVNAQNRMSYDWQCPVWQDEQWFNESPFSAIHFCHVSQENPNMVAYIQTPDKLKRDISTATKPGRYLKTYFGEVLSDEQIKKWAERHEAKYSTELLKNVQISQDPDMWEWVYENGQGYTSCMTYNRDGRHLNSRMCGPNHPVRSYAHPRSDLAIAYLPTTSKPFPDHKAAARTIVNIETKEYVRIYGDERLGNALELMGYTHNAACMRGQPIAMREYTDGEYIVPYIDGGFGLDIEGDHFIITPGGTYDGDSASGIIYARTATVECGCCGNDIAESDSKHIEALEGYICSDCLDEYYCFACTRRGRQIWTRKDDAIYCESDGEWYDAQYYTDHNIDYCERSGNYYHIDELCLVDSEYIHKSYCTELDERHYDDSYALDRDTLVTVDNKRIHRDDAVQTVDGDDIYEGDAVKCYITGGTYHCDNEKIVEYAVNGAVLYVHLDALNDAPLKVFDAFRIVTDWEFNAELLPVSVTTAGATFEEYLKVYGSSCFPRKFVNIAEGDVDVTFDTAINEFNTSIKLAA